MQIYLGKPYCPNRKKSPRLPRNRILAIISQTTRVPNPLCQLILSKMTKEPRKKERILSVIATIAGKIIMMNLVFSTRWKPWKKQ